MAQSSTDSIITTVEGWFAKLPNLPKDARGLLVKITPWFALIFGVLGILGGIAGLGLLTAFSGFALIGGAGQALGSGLIASILLLVSSALLLAAFPGTNARRMQGWKLLFWSEAVSLVSAVLGFSVSGIIFSLIGFYIIFQIKSYYK